MEISGEKLKTIWEKGMDVEKYDPSKFRKDVCGAWMAWEQYGKDSPLGWGIDHIYPTSKGGNENLENLRPMHWENNKSKKDDYPSYTAIKTSEGDSNINKEQRFNVLDSIQATLKQLYNIR